MAQKINYSLTRGCDLLLWPLQKLPPFWGILLLSLLTSLFVLAVYRAVSNPKKVTATKNQIKAHILAIRLYRDFWKVIIVSFFKSLYYTGKYFILNLVPLVLVFPLLFLLFVQMDIRYGMRPFRVDEDIVVKAGFNQDISKLAIELQDDPHFQTRMNPVFINALREVNWKLRANQNSAGAIAINVNGTTVHKNLLIGENVPALSNKKMTASSWAHFIYPFEKLLAPAPALKYISLQYPARRIDFLGLHAHWIVYYLVLTMIIALALKNKFGVEF
ncbi:MAG: hypothetical protein WCL37_06280 [Chrysiogenales bacterium]